MEHYSEVTDFIAAVKADAVCLIGDFTTQIIFFVWYGTQNP